jgi:hypothetical protein
MLFRRLFLGDGGWSRGAITVALLVGVVAFGEWGMRWLMAPWSYAALGPTLTGTWEGPLRARLGSEYRVFLDLEYRAPGRRSRLIYSRLVGRGWICTRRGEVYEYEVDGSANRSGNQVEIGLEYVDPVQSALGNRLEGGWNGETLTLRPLTNPFMPDGSFVLHRGISSSDPDDSFASAELRKSDRATFLSNCGRLQR